jgi:hypothetical protein
MTASKDEYINRNRRMVVEIRRNLAENASVAVVAVALSRPGFSSGTRTALCALNGLGNRSASERPAAAKPFKRHR